MKEIQKLLKASKNMTFCLPISSLKALPHLPACPASPCSKRVTDHAAAPGCRPALNIDVLRVLGVCRSPHELLAAMAALEARFGGCGRVKNGFATADAKAAEGFHLRVMMGNFVADFRCTYAELAARPGVADMWAAHVASAPEGGAPRDRWLSAAAEARDMLKASTKQRLAERNMVELVLNVGMEAIEAAALRHGLIEEWEAGDVHTARMKGAEPPGVRAGLISRWLLSG